LEKIVKILAVDIGTGTQDILLFDARLDVENSFKMVLPAPTMIIHRRLKEATRQRKAVLLSGVMMGGGPSAWAAEDHAKAGLAIYATPDAARTLNDDLTAVEAAGIRVISEDEAVRLPADVERVEMRDFDLPAIRRALAEFGVPLDDIAAVAVAVFDHGNAPPDISDRQFRFDYLDEHIRAAGARGANASNARESLAAFAFLRGEIPPSMTRLQAVAACAAGLDAPLVVMDTAPAAVLGATFDPRAQALEQKIIANVGNFHTLAFRLGAAGIEGVFEHHTGLVNTARLEALLLALAGSTLKHEDVFGDHGHGALIYNDTPFDLSSHPGSLVVTGPRRAMLADSHLQPIFAVPFGDMMIAGCFGLLYAAAERLPNLRETILHALTQPHGLSRPPWEVE
jgi:uncharacterized protein (DUF1786 family)